MARRAATEGERASARCCAGIWSFLFPVPEALPLLWWPKVFDPEKRAFSGDGTSTGRLGLRIMSSIVGGGGVCDLLSVAARGDRCLASGVAGSLSREVLRSNGLVLLVLVGVAGGLEYLKDLGTSMLLLTMALKRKGRVSRPCGRRWRRVSQGYAADGPFTTVCRTR